MGRQVNATPKPTRAIAQGEVTHVHVDDGDMGIVGVHDEAHPRRPESVGRRVHLGLQGGRCLPFHLAEIDAATLPHLSRSQHACAPTSTSGSLPRIFDKGRAAAFRLHSFNAGNNPVLQRTEIVGQGLESFLVHGCSAGGWASGYSSGNKCWYISGTAIKLSSSV